MTIDIREISSYVLSLKTGNKAQRAAVTEKMSSLGIEKWEFFDAIDVRGKVPAWIGCGLSHRECLVNAVYPCIVYEDDIEPTRWFRSVIEDPGDRILYLGLSVWGTKSGVSTIKGSAFIDYSDELAIVQHMVSTHAVYYPNREVAMQFSGGIVRHLFEKGRPFDEHYAGMQIAEETLCLKQPLFYQGDPKTVDYTHVMVKNGMADRD